MKYFIPLLTLLFIGLKLTGHIDWSWWLVASPLYIGFFAHWLFVFTAVMIVERFGSDQDRIRLRLKGWF